MNEKQYQLIFLVAFFSVLIGVGIGYFMFANDGVDRQKVAEQEQENEDLPPGLIEGFIYEINVDDQFMVVDIRSPEEISGERVEISFDSERTRFQELFLEVYGPNDIVDAGKQSLDYKILTANDNVLIDIGGVASESIRDGKTLSAKNITLITEK